MGINGGTGIVGSGATLGGSGIHINRGGGGSGFDPDAQAFIDAVGADATISEYINTMFLGMKGEGTTNGTNFYSKLYAVYPMAPSDASTISDATTKWNAVNPLDTDAAFRITWTNTPLFSLSLGVGQNGSNNAFGNTHFIESANMTAGNNGTTFSVSDLPASGNYYMGGALTGFNFAQRLAFNASWGVYSANQLISSSFSVGVNTASRRSATDFESYRNGVSAGTNIANASGQSTVNFFLLGLNNGGSLFNPFTGGYIDFAVLHDGLTANEAQDLYDVINTWKTNLGR